MRRPQVRTATRARHAQRRPHRTILAQEGHRVDGPVHLVDGAAKVDVCARAGQQAHACWRGAPQYALHGGSRWCAAPRHAPHAAQPPTRPGLGPCRRVTRYLTCQLAGRRLEQLKGAPVGDLHLLRRSRAASAPLAHLRGLCVPGNDAYIPSQLGQLGDGGWVVS